MTPQAYRFTLGAFRLHVLLDGAASLGAAGILRRYPDAAEAEYRQAFADLGRSLDDADSAFNLLLIEGGGACLLVDTGEGGRPKGGWIDASLRLAGRAPDDITHIVITHTHRDHILGLLTPDGTPRFPGAQVILSATEMADWRAGDAAQRDDERALLAWLDARGARLVAMDETILPGITAVPLPGHTPGQIGLLIESGGERLLHLADALHQPFQFAHPEWSPTFDADTSISVPTRRAALARAADLSALTLVYHLTFPGLGRVRRGSAGFIWDAVIR